MRPDPKVTIDKQIAILKRKKLKIQQEQAVILLKKLKRIFGKEYSHELISAIASKTWQNATPQEKEIWRSHAHSFCQLSYDKAVQAGTEDHNQTPGTPTKEVSTND
jgi:hypothetical protein